MINRERSKTNARRPGDRVRLTLVIHDRPSNIIGGRRDGQEPLSEKSKEMDEEKEKWQEMNEEKIEEMGKRWTKRE
jgi:hypothetical protein